MGRSRSWITFWRISFTTALELIKVMLSFCFQIQASIYKQITFVSLCVIISIAGRAQDLQAVTAVLIGLSQTDFFLLLVGRDEVIGQASCNLSWGYWSKSCHIRRVTGISRNVPT